MNKFASHATTGHDRKEVHKVLLGFDANMAGGIGKERPAKKHHVTPLPIKHFRWQPPLLEYDALAKVKRAHEGLIEEVSARCGETPRAAIWFRRFLPCEHVGLHFGEKKCTAGQTSGVCMAPKLSTAATSRVRCTEHARGHEPRLLLMLPWTTRSAATCRRSLAVAQSSGGNFQVVESLGYKSWVTSSLLSWRSVCPMCCEEAASPFVRHFLYHHSRVARCVNDFDAAQRLDTIWALPKASPHPVRVPAATTVHFVLAFF